MSKFSAAIKPAKTAVTHTNTDYVGQYVNVMRDLTIAALASKVNIMLVSEPGAGKTEIMESLLNGICGADHTGRVDLSPSSPMSAINGKISEKDFMEKGRYRLDMDGTPFDPNMRGIILDELFRASDPAYDAILHATDPLKQSNAVVVGTSNFIIKETRVAAMRERFAIYYWIGATGNEPDDLVRARMTARAKGISPTIPGDLPTWDLIEMVRNAKPGQRAVDAVSDFVCLLAEEARKDGFHLSNRILGHWEKIIYAVSVLYTGEADFDVIPQQARDVIAYCYPTTSHDEAAKWLTLAKSISDPVMAIIDSIMANAVVEFRRVAAIKDQNDRLGNTGVMGQLIGESQRALQPYAADPRVATATATLSQWLQDAIQGNKITL